MKKVIIKLKVIMKKIKLMRVRLMKIMEQILKILIKL